MSSSAVKWLIWPQASPGVATYAKPEPTAVETLVAKYPNGRSPPWLRPGMASRQPQVIRNTIGERGPKLPPAVVQG
jgi:hypothetical protein